MGSILCCYDREVGVANEHVGRPGKYVNLFEFSRLDTHWCPPSIVSAPNVSISSIDALGGGEVATGKVVGVEVIYTVDI